ARAEPEEAPDREADGEAEPGLAAVAHRRGADAVDPRGRHPPREEAGACRGESRQSEEEDTEQNLMALRPLTGPRLPPARGQATHLVVLCHGYGADGNDLIGLAPHWQRMLPTVAFVAPNAPEPCAGSPMGYQWFPITRLDPGEMGRGVENAAQVLSEFLDAELKRLELTDDRMALVGFSQGTMMSLHVGLNRPAKPAAIVGFSGIALTNPPTLG